MDKTILVLGDKPEKRLNLMKGMTKRELLKSQPVKVEFELVPVGERGYSIEKQLQYEWLKHKEEHPVTLMTEEQVNSPFAWRLIDEDRTLVLGDKMLYRVKINDLKMEDEDFASLFDLDGASDILTPKVFLKYLQRISGGLSINVSGFECQLSNNPFKTNVPPTIWTVRAFVDEIITAWMKDNEKHQAFYARVAPLFNAGKLPTYETFNATELMEGSIIDSSARLYNFFQQPELHLYFPEAANITKEDIEKAISENKWSFYGYANNMGRLKEGLDEYILWQAITLEGVLSVHGGIVDYRDEDALPDVIRDIVEVISEDVLSTNVFPVKGVKQLARLYREHPSTTVSLWNVSPVYPL